MLFAELYLYLFCGNFAETDILAAQKLNCGDSKVYLDKKEFDQVFFMFLLF